MAEKVSPNVEPETRRFLEQVNAAGGKPLWELSPQDARKVLSDLQAGADVEKLPADLEDRMIPGGPGNKGVSVRIVRPKGRTDALPVIMHFHGGGWVLGDKNTHDRLVRELADGAQAAVVFVDYTPAPGGPATRSQIEQAYAATQWIAENGESLKASTRLAARGRRRQRRRQHGRGADADGQGARRPALATRSSSTRSRTPTSTRARTSSSPTGHFLTPRRR